MRVGLMVAAAAAALMSAGQATAARYYEFELFGVAPVTYFDPYGVQQPVSFNRASRFTASFDTGSAGPPPLYATGVNEVDSFLYFGPTELKSLNKPGGVYFDLMFDLSLIQIGLILQPIAATGTYGYLNCTNRYQICTNIPLANYTFKARTSDTAPTVLGETEAVLFTAVPEPATWAMMLTGIGMIGAAARRKRTIKATAKIARS